MAIVRARGGTPMSARSTREGALAQAPSPKGILGKQMLLWLLVGCVLLTAFEVGIRHVPPDAVQISQSAAATGRTLASREITDARTVADFSARINSLPVAP